MTETEIVGILNITPDSFTDGGKYVHVDNAFARAIEMHEQGASIIDIGAESTRPNADQLSVDQETDRLLPFLRRVHELNAGISIDTYKPEVVYSMIRYIDDFIVNDVTGCYNPLMRETIADLSCKVIISHLPEYCEGSIQKAHKEKPINSVQQVIDELGVRVDQFSELGVGIDNIILDPGLGFGKTQQINFDLLEFAKYVPEFEVMIGYSRKKFFGEKHKEINVNLQAGRVAIDAGAKYLRVHDVKEHYDLVNSE